jgi:hypothetical protein
MYLACFEFDTDMLVFVKLYKILKYFSTIVQFTSIPASEVCDNPNHAVHYHIFRL